MFNKGIIYKGWWGNHKGLVLLRCIALSGDITGLRPEEERPAELSVGRPPYKNVAPGVCIPLVSKALSLISG